MTRGRESGPFFLASANDAALLSWPSARRCAAPPPAACACRRDCGVPQHRSAAALLLDAPALHHRHAVGDVLDHADVVRDEEVATRRVSRCSSRSRFRICACTDTSSAEVGSSQTISRGSHRQRARDGDALALAAGELVRVALQRVAPQADLVDQRARAAARRALRSMLGAQREQAFLEDVEHAHARVQRRERVLEDDLHRAPRRRAARRRRA